MAEHTPGPWHLSPAGQYIRYVGIHGPNICNTDVFGGPLEECVANARLIAAAPELLAACKAMLNDIGYHCDEDGCECGDFDEKRTCCHVQALAAIAKAEGRTP